MKILFKIGFLIFASLGFASCKSTVPVKREKKVINFKMRDPSGKPRISEIHERNQTQEDSSSKTPAKKLESIYKPLFPKRTGRKTIKKIKGNK